MRIFNPSKLLSQSRIFVFCVLIGSFIWFINMARGKSTKNITVAKRNKRIKEWEVKFDAERKKKEEEEFLMEEDLKKKDEERKKKLDLDIKNPTKIN